jgi:hypothetical protein
LFLQTAQTDTSGEGKLHNMHRWARLLKQQLSITVYRLAIKEKKRFPFPSSANDGSCRFPFPFAVN